MRNRIAQHQADPDARSALAPVENAEAVDHYIPTPDVTQNPPPSGS